MRSTYAFIVVWTAVAWVPVIEAQSVRSSAPAGRSIFALAIAADSVTLRDVLARVRDGHPLALAADARIDAARGSRSTAGAFTNPMFQYQVENTPLPGRDPVPMDREAMTTAMIPLEPLYQRGSRIARADADVRAAQADARAQRLGLAATASRSFYRVAIAQVSVEVTRDLSAWLDSVVTYNRARVNEGIAAEADLIRAQLEQDRIAAELSMQEADLARERATLSSYLGVPRSSAPFAVVITEQPLVWSLTEVADAMSGAREGSAALVDRTPQVIAAREHVRSTDAGIGVERRMIVRDLSATLGTKRTAGFTSLIAGVSLPLPLFTRNRGEVARASAEHRAAEFELAAVQRIGSAELAGALDAATILLDRAVRLAAPEVGSSSQAPALLARANESRRIALGAYREGAVPLLSVLDAARAWGDVRVTFYRALFAQHESMLSLAAALGLPPEQVLTTPAPVLQVPR